MGLIGNSQLLSKLSWHWRNWNGDWDGASADGAYSVQGSSTTASGDYSDGSMGFSSTTASGWLQWQLVAVNYIQPKDAPTSHR
jgi:hypothetical protein